MNKLINFLKYSFSAFLLIFSIFISIEHNAYVSASLLVLSSIFILISIKHQIPKWLMSLRVLFIVVFTFTLTAEVIYTRIQKEEAVKAQLEAERVKKLEEEKEAANKEFKENREDILLYLSKLIEDKNTLQFEVDAHDYRYINDKELQKLRDEFKSIKSEIEKRNRIIQNKKHTESIIEELKTIPESEYLENLTRYKRLAVLNPETDKFDKKINYYQSKFDAKQEEERKIKERKDTIDSHFNWDGSHILLEYLIKKNMHDKDSYEHVKTIYWDNTDYLTVQMTYRGKNAFGAKVINTITAKITLKGVILEIY